MEVYLTVKEVAELKNCSARYIRMMIDEGKIKAEQIRREVQGPGRGGIQYRIPLTSLDEKLKLKHKRLQRKKEDTPRKDIIPPEEVKYDSEVLSKSERSEIDRWNQIISEWRKFRNSSSLSKEEADEEFIRLQKISYPGILLNRRTLYRKWKALNSTGEQSLLDRRGKHGNHNKKLTDYVWDIFEHFYLDETQKSVTLCVLLTQLELEAQVKEKTIDELPEMPKEGAFLKKIKDIPIPCVEYFRHGEKSYISKCEPYIKRMYDDLEPNDIWVADNHTFDVIVSDGGKNLRLYLTAFMDVRTRKMMGWCVTPKPCSDATIYALRKGVEKFGIPKMIYTDNGREFLFHDFGGNGFRKKKQSNPGDTCESALDANGSNHPTILKNLGISFRTALPKNARAKGVERAFGTLANNFSKLFEAYTGGNVTKKPDRLKEVVKDSSKLKTVREFSGFADTWIAGWYNKQPHSGEGMYGRSPDETYAEMLVEQRIATETQLNLMFMRWTKPMKVGKNGITLTFYDEKLQYFDHDLWINYFGKEVYVRYSPDDLEEVRVYDINERFICTAKLKEGLSFHASKDEIAERSRQNRRATKAVKEFKKAKDIKSRNELELLLDKAAQNLSDEDKIRAEVLIPVFNNELTGNIAVGQAAAFDEDRWTAALENYGNQRR